MSNALDALLTAHGGWNNFANEAPHARTLGSLIPANGEVANNIVHKYIKALTMCRMGNGYGVSWAGQGVYDTLISRWQDKHIAIFVRLASDSEVASRLHLGQCARNYQHLAASLEPQATNAQLKLVLEFIKDFPTAKAGVIAQDARFKTLIGALRIR